PSPVNASSWVPSPPPPLSTRTSVPSIHSRCRGQSVATAHTVSGAAATGTLSRNSTDGTLFLRVVLRALVPGLVQRLSRSLQLPLQDRNPAAQLVQLTGDPVERPVHLGGLVAAEHLLELQRPNIGPFDLRRRQPGGGLLRRQRFQLFPASENHGGQQEHHRGDGEHNEQVDERTCHGGQSWHERRTAHRLAEASTPHACPAAAVNTPSLAKVTARHARRGTCNARTPAWVRR